MGCIQSRKNSIIKVQKRSMGTIKELAITQSSPTNKKRSTLKELSRLA